MEGTIATIMMFAGTFAPKNWAYCAGQILPITQNTALFSLIGTYYGGNGTTTFGLPDLQGRVAVGVGQGPGLSNYSLGQVGGSPTHTLTQNEMAAHTHTSGAVQIPVSGNNASLEEAGGHILATPATEIYATPGTTPAVNHPGFSATVLNNGMGMPFSIMQPYECVNFVICLYGIYPSRP
jgi:microcystin-dependent protein